MISDRSFAPSTVVSKRRKRSVSDDSTVNEAYDNVDDQLYDITYEAPEVRKTIIFIIPHINKLSCCFKVLIFKPMICFDRM